MTTDELEIWKRLKDCECVHPGYWLPLNGDRYIWIDADGNPHVKIYYIRKEEINGSCIWIPPLYDPIRPERSLWGMSEDIRHRWGSQFEEACFLNTARPDLALAKAIIEMEEKK